MRQDRRQRLRQVTEKIIGLSALPTIVTQLIALVGDPKSSARDVAQLISTDQALTAKILKVANSAFYGFPRKIPTVQLAIVVLGFQAVKNLGLSMTVLKRFSRGKDHPLFDRERFWEHAIGCGVAARMLARKLRFSVEGEAFVGGILHDIGKLVLMEYFPEEFSEALEQAESEELSIAESEERVIGVTHAEVGGWLAEKWNLPSPLVDTIAYHHRPQELKEPDDLVHLIHVANALVRQFGVGSSGDRQGPRLDPAVATRFKRGRELSDEELLNVLGTGLEEELEKAQIFRDLDAE
jgi:putative nucleotidyltransferase with HDIG domain